MPIGRSRSRVWLPGWIRLRLRPCGLQAAHDLQRRRDLHMSDVDGDGSRYGEGDRIGDIGCLRQLEAVDEPLPDAGIIAVDVIENIRGDPAGADFGHPHALAESVDAQLVRQHAHACLGGVIGGVSSEIIGAGDRRDVDDVAAVARHHARHDEAADVQNRAEIDVDEEIDIALVGFQKLLRPVDAGIVDENVELHPARERGDRRPIGHIDGMGDTARTLGQLLQSFSAAGNGMDLDILPAKPLNHGCADPGGCAGHQCGLVVGEWHCRSLVVDRDSSEALTPCLRPIISGAISNGYGAPRPAQEENAEMPVFSGGPPRQAASRCKSNAPLQTCCSQIRMVPRSPWTSDASNLSS
ncbi:hypothetical protein RHECNPAF_1360079 [Rhizobium etli CNPAF512]|nr:hypothetical protein RHECNPAF_1360079 [Rhizobium etli CNPAF512]